MMNRRQTKSSLHHTERNSGSIPDSLNRQIPWSRILVRSGFNATKSADSFDFASETEENRKYFKNILRLSDAGGMFEGNLFYPLNPEINEQIWLQTIECYHTGAEGGKPGFNSIELEIMDTFMAGFTRWINYIGIGSYTSCDGHGVRTARFTAVEGDIEVLNRCLKLVSNTQIRLTAGRLHLPGSSGYTIKNIRLILLDLAEALYARQDELTEYVKSDRELMKQFRSNTPGRYQLQPEMDDQNPEYLVHPFSESS